MIIYQFEKHCTHYFTSQTQTSKLDHVLSHLNKMMRGSRLHIKGRMQRGKNCNQFIHFWSRTRTGRSIGALINIISAVEASHGCT
uniref:Uncharacterized protein n=1 Tax=Picea glauca TaxID=3330 RepID=A0A101LUG5_PICGL|nr:hypothetical protein ABT39_MTgene2417 [Picea glauca]QHR86769.1 hypothetical protein Q903MT_gene773 [Picea sitchensis]